MQMQNTIYKEEILPEILSYFSELTWIIQSERSEDFSREFDIIKKHVWQNFLDKALNISSAFDEHIKKAL